MAIELSTSAEQQAQKAEKLQAFSGLNLLHIKRQVAELLKAIGANGIFDEYTRHDISHIDAMLTMLDWVIPEKTRDRMSTADWLMVVLAVYFHDAGMLVTKAEYANRERSKFPDFRDSHLFSTDHKGKDYRAKVETLPAHELDRFLYQEFVRAHHAARVRAWVVGSSTSELGVTEVVTGEVDALLKPLGSTFRGDLGMVCESHHLEDLDILKKYKTSQPYGTSEAETANLQYAAVLLRTVDLLHITSDRTPSIAFRLLNPADPISQREWAKQMAVRTVRSQPAKDEDGNVNPKLPRDTIEVHATFTEEEGFFGLTSFLDYAEKELRLSHDWVAQAQKREGAPHEFPWRRIDQSHIETEGFLREQFEFTIDQARILDLLTGHTLYNDTSVVLRELVQNSIDAIRLAFHDGQGRRSRDEGFVRVAWDSRKRTLTVTDNGTGMTQEIIEDHLLKVGASRYQDPKFKEQHPDFNPISRFGIGILSAFMIADEVEIITCSQEEDSARRLLLRSVHGKYLIRVLPKNADEAVRAIARPARHNSTADSEAECRRE